MVYLIQGIAPFAAVFFLFCARRKRVEEVVAILLMAQKSPFWIITEKQKPAPKKLREIYHKLPEVVLKFPNFLSENQPVPPPT